MQEEGCWGREVLTGPILMRSRKVLGFTLSFSQDGLQAARAIRERRQAPVPPPSGGVPSSGAATGPAAPVPHSSKADTEEARRSRATTHHAAAEREAATLQRYFAEIPIIALTAYVSEDDKNRLARGPSEAERGTADTGNTQRMGCSIDRCASYSLMLTSSHFTSSRSRAFPSPPARPTRRCFECGMSDFLAKPVGIAQLGECLRRWCTAAAGPEHGGRCARKPAGRRQCDGSWRV